MVVQWCPCSRAKTRQSNCYYTGERPPSGRRSGQWPARGPVRRGFAPRHTTLPHPPHGLPTFDGAVCNGRCNGRNGRRRLDGPLQVEQGWIDVHVRGQADVGMPHQLLSPSHRDTGPCQHGPESRSKCMQIDLPTAAVASSDPGPAAVGVKPSDQVGGEVEHPISSAASLDAPTKHGDKVGSKGDRVIPTVLCGCRVRRTTGIGPSRSR